MRTIAYIQKDLKGLEWIQLIYTLQDIISNPDLKELLFIFLSGEKDVNEIARFSAVLDNPVFHQVCDYFNRRIGENSGIPSVASSFPSWYGAVMTKLGGPTHLKGYKYVEYALMLLIEDPTAIQRITKQIYPHTANHFSSEGATPSRVERAIRHFIENCYTRCPKQTWKDFFNQRDEITNGEFLATLADRYRRSTN